MVMIVLVSDLHVAPLLICTHTDGRFWQDVDWEYPGGNGQDYKQNPNSGKTDEITNFALLLKEIKAAIGTKELSIAVPGLQRDMIAFTPQQAPLINAAVDVVNVGTENTHVSDDTANERTPRSWHTIS